MVRALYIGKNPGLESSLTQVLGEVSPKFVLDSLILDEALPSYEYFEKFDFIFFDNQAAKGSGLNSIGSLNQCF